MVEQLAVARQPLGETLVCKRGELFRFCFCKANNKIRNAVASVNLPSVLETHTLYKRTGNQQPSPLRGRFRDYPSGVLEHICSGKRLAPSLLYVVGDDIVHALWKHWGHM